MCTVSKFVFPIGGGHTSQYIYGYAIGGSLVVQVGVRMVESMEVLEIGGL